jgi:hypothetical protein
MKRILIIAAAIVLAGCSSFKMGAACYIPYGQVGGCTVAPPAK